MSVVVLLVPWGWYRVRELQSRKGADAAFSLHRWETNAWRWEQIAQPRALLCSSVAVRTEKTGKEKGEEGT